MASRDTVPSENQRSVRASRRCFNCVGRVVCISAVVRSIALSDLLPQPAAARTNDSPSDNIHLLPILCTPLSLRTLPVTPTPPLPCESARAARGRRGGAWLPAPSPAPSPCQVIDSPAVGTRPNSANTNPPIVSNVLVLRQVEAHHRVDLVDVGPAERFARVVVDLADFLLRPRGRYSSSISPTISSSTSSIVTRPETPPYSSSTMAMCVRLCWNSCSKSSTAFVSGTNSGLRSSSRQRPARLVRRPWPAPAAGPCCRGCRRCRRGSCRRPACACGRRSMTYSSTSSHGVLSLDHVHLGPRRHDVRDDDVAQLDDALDHLAGLFLEQPFAVAFGDDRADFLLERLLVGLRAACGPVRRCSTASKPRASQTSGIVSRLEPSPAGPGVVQKPLGADPGDRPRQADTRRRPAPDASASTIGQPTRATPTGSATTRSQPYKPAGDRRTASIASTDEHLDAERDFVVMADDVAEAVELLPPLADFLQIVARKLAQRARADRREAARQRRRRSPARTRRQRSPTRSVPPSRPAIADRSRRNAPRIDRACPCRIAADRIVRRPASAATSASVWSSIADQVQHAVDHVQQLLVRRRPAAFRAAAAAAVSALRTTSPSRWPSRSSSTKLSTSVGQSWFRELPIQRVNRRIIDDRQADRRRREFRIREHAPRRVEQPLFVHGVGRLLVGERKLEAVREMRRGQ